MYSTLRAGAAASGLRVVGVFAKDRRPVAPAAKLPAALRAKVESLLSLPGFRADAGETACTGGDVLLLGLGGADDAKLATFRNAAGRLLKALARMEAKAVQLDLGGAAHDAGLAHEAVGRAVGEGLGLANFRVDFFDGKATRRPARLPRLAVQAGDRALAEGLREGLLLAECTNEARRLAATPPNIANPPWMAKEARRLARAAGLRCTVIGYEEAKRRGMGGIVNVGKGSASKPCMIVLEHRPARPAKGVRLALVGKTMTYDTGGYSLKVNNGMKGMKYDGNGGCAVLGAMLAVARLKAPVHVFGVLPCAENMVSDDSYRPDDIITMANGVTVEVTNTDAEGRLILGDALVHACRDLKATAVVDVATLTGGVVVALGEWCAGLFCNDDDLRTRLESAADATDERVWRLPLWTEHRDFMRAKHADLWNSGPKRDGHPIQGAAFLSFFVDEKIPWAHIDIAGTSSTDGDTATCVAGPTGFGVRLLAEAARRMAGR